MRVENIAHLCAIKGTCNGRTEFSNPSLISKVIISRNSSNEPIHVIGTLTIDAVDDLNFTFYDYFALSGVDYNYYCIPVVNGVKQVGVSDHVHSHFDNLFIGNLYEQYVGVINLEYNHSLVFNRNYAQTYYSNFPYAIINGDQKYEVGSVSGVFIEFDASACRFKVDESGAYRRKLKHFLATADNKIIKTHDGDIWAVQINGEVKEGGATGNVPKTTSFDWTQVDEAPTKGLIIITSDGSKKVVIE